MKASEIRQRLKPWMLPIAMLMGLLLHRWIGHVIFLSPYLIFVMLFITFCRINLRHLEISSLMVKLLIVQVCGSLAVYYLLAPLSLDVAQAIFICIFCPTATAAPVVTGMLGGNVGRLVSYSLVSNITVALTAPVILSRIGGADMDFLRSVGIIMQRVAPMILAPLVLALVAGRVAPRFHGAVANHQGISFYVWAVSLLIVVGNSVSFILAEPSDKIGEIIWIALGAGLACVAQFAIGRLLGRRHGDAVSGAQGLGQKNTVLAIWLALTYLNPISSVGPAAYIAWQNTINSVQLYFRQKSTRQGSRK